MGEHLPGIHKAYIPAPTPSRCTGGGGEIPALAIWWWCLLGNNGLTWDFYFRELEHWTICQSLNLQSCHCLHLMCGLQSCQPDGNMWQVFLRLPLKSSGCTGVCLLGMLPLSLWEAGFLSTPLWQYGILIRFSEHGADQRSYTYLGCFPPGLWISWCWQVMAWSSSLAASGCKDLCSQPLSVLGLLRAVVLPNLWGRLGTRFKVPASMLAHDLGLLPSSVVLPNLRGRLAAEWGTLLAGAGLILITFFAPESFSSWKLTLLSFPPFGIPLGYN